MIPVPLPEIDFPGGCCHFVATPIGNAADIGLRALAVLAAADTVYAEDTRHTGRLLQHLGLRVPMRSCHDHNERQRVDEIVEAVERLSRSRIGAIIALEQEVGLDEYADKGTPLEARVSADLVATIFTPSSPLHDGAVLIQGD